MLGIVAALWLLSGWVRVEWQTDRGYIALAGGRVFVITGRCGRPLGARAFASPAAFSWLFRGNFAPLNREVAVPLWAIGVAIGAAGLGREVRRRRDPGLCACGYPVVGLVRCPECGVEVGVMGVMEG